MDTPEQPIPGKVYLRTIIYSTKDDSEMGSITNKVRCAELTGDIPCDIIKFQFLDSPHPHDPYGGTDRFHTSIKNFPVGIRTHDIKSGYEINIQYIIYTDPPNP